MTIWPVVPAAGVGSRMQADRPKQYLTIAGRLLMDYTLSALLSHPHVHQLILVLSDEDEYWPDSDFYRDERILLASGGAERSDSVLNGLQRLSALASEEDWVLVHDVARPCLTHEDIDALLSQRQRPGAILASPTRDTMKRGKLDESGNVCIEHTVEREQLWHALTPQMFPLGVLKQALAHCQQQDIPVTDEASALEALGHSPRLIAGRADNIKVTRPEDLALAELFLQQAGRLA